MEMLEKITPEELDAIRDYIYSYAGEDGCPLYSSDGINVKHILRFWAKEKITLCRLFGGNLILSKPISYKIPPRELEDKIDRELFDSEAGSEFVRNFNVWNNNTFTRSNIFGNSHIYCQLRSLLYLHTLASNTYNGDKIVLPVNEKKKIVVNPGCKVSKVLGKIAAAFNIKGYEDFRIAHSMCLNQKRLEGELCLSIHPLDYMTMSDNDCDWESCMNWRYGGDYRQGTVEMMNSPCVVVAYLKSSSDMELIDSGDNSFMWNNKKWRQLYIVTPEVISNIKPYPYANPDLDIYCKEWLRELAEKDGGFGTYLPTLQKIFNRDANILSDGKAIHFSFTTNVMHNDYSGEHEVYVSSGLTNGQSVQINFSGVTECMYCGQDYSEYRDNIPTSSLLCSECGHFRVCEDCGYHLDEDEGYWVDEVLICDSCFNRYTVDCLSCDDTHFKDNMNRVYFKHNDKYIGNSSTSVFVCDHCLHDKQSTIWQELGPIQWDEKEFRYFVDVLNITENGLDAISYTIESGYALIEEIISYNNQQKESI